MGLFYFRGLWLTLKKMTTNKNIWLLLLTSFLVRLTICGLVFYGVMLVSNLQGLVSSFLGFMVMRIIAVNFWGIKQSN